MGRRAILLVVRPVCLTLRLGSMFIVDDIYDLEGLNILAAHAQGIDPRVRDVLEEHWTGSNLDLQTFYMA